MKACDIKTRVIIKLEEFSPFGPPTDSNPLLAAGGGDNITEIKPVFSYIDEHIDEAADEILMALPIHKFRNDIIDGEMNPFIYQDLEITGYSDEESDIRHTAAVVIEPKADFLRMYSLKFPEWERPVYTTLKPAEEGFLLQANIWNRGTCQKPVVTYDGRLLRAYTVAYNGTSREFTTEDDHEFLYIRHFKYTYTSLDGEGSVGDDDIDYPDDVAELISLNCAKKVLEVYGEREQVETVEKEIQLVLGNMML